ncbi:hypothetical protein G7062_03815 [Erysipelothrix sp. HDW6C]|uniref:hypothetical protein n=1 Tax=Erysipelothrix sp. HDW6C TaxID=2714930 RepID=UPI00140BE598|nr:hypothetical protein [Erysipelothrix sp. HDW6C]QIK69471.1 hypothetical protein G7062_03815 [Erysipelothrix sp. HDW6C]
MRKRIKFVTVDKIEYREYEDFLNRMGADGWHLSHANAFCQTFEYQPDMKRYYAVIPNLKMTGMGRIHEYEKQKVSLEESGYAWHTAAGATDVYTSTTMKNFHEHVGIDYQALLEIMETDRKTHIFLIVVYAIIFAFYLSMPQSIVLSRMSQLLMISYFLIVASSIRYLWNYSRLKKRIYKPTKTKFKSLRTDILSNSWHIIYLCVLLLIFQTISYNRGWQIIVYYIALFSVTLVLIVVLNRVASAGKLAGKNHFRFSLLIVLVFFLSGMLVGSKIDSDTKPPHLPQKFIDIGCFAPESQFFEPSWIVQRTEMTCQGENVSLFEYKIPFMRTLLRSIIVRQDVVVSEGVVTEIQNYHYNGSVYVLEFDNYMVLSYEQISASLSERLLEIK